MADMFPLTVVCAVQKIRGGKSVTQDPDVRKESQFESTWILIFIFHPVWVCKFGFDYLMLINGHSGAFEAVPCYRRFTWNLHVEATPVSQGIP